VRSQDWETHQENRALEQVAPSKVTASEEKATLVNNKERRKDGKQHKKTRGYSMKNLL
jgi:hypothetical protein